MKKGVFSFLGMALLWGSAVSFAADAPAPAASSSKMRPQRKTPAKRRQRLSPLQVKLRDTLHAYIKRTIDKNYGFYPIEDREYEETWMGQLKGIDMSKVRRVFEDEYIVRAHFKELPMIDDESEGPEAEKPPTQSFVVDFTLLRAPSGLWHVKKEALQGINGESLFTYSETNERIPLDRDRARAVFAIGGRESAEGPADGRGEDDPFVPEELKDNSKAPPRRGGQDKGFDAYDPNNNDKNDKNDKDTDDDRDEEDTGN